MIANYLDRTALIAELESKRALLAKTLKDHTKGTKDGEAARALLAKYEFTPAELPELISLLALAIKEAKADTGHPAGSAFIPSSPLVCTLQTGMTLNAKADAKTRLEQNRQPAPPTAGKGGRSRAASKAKVIDTSAPIRLKDGKSKTTRGKTIGGFIENDDVLYALKGAKGKAQALASGPRPFNPNPACPVISTKPLSLYLFGDWGTGLPMAQQVTRSICKQLKQEDESTQAHVIHLGDVYYIGEAKEYQDYMLAESCWPILLDEEIERYGSWSLDGNHDRYSGGYGYFDTLLRDKRFIRWHADDKGEPSSFFLIENDDWQVFGLDTSWELPGLVESVTQDTWTVKDYAGQNGILTFEQVDWMKRVRNKDKGCILLTHHQPASSRTSEKQHADATVAALKNAELSDSTTLYDSIDAWIWGHEHRGVVFKPKEKRKHPVLKQAPSFCCCLGHGGVPVTKKNFELENTIGDVLWQEDRLDSTAPIYQGKPVVPFGFGKLETSGKTFRFTVFDHTGDKRFAVKYTKGAAWEETFRAPAPTPAAGAAKSRSVRSISKSPSRSTKATPKKKASAKKAAVKKPAAKKVPAKKATPRAKTKPAVKAPVKRNASKAKPKARVVRIKKPAPVKKGKPSNKKRR
ncbi:MAG: metallophosphoesterase [Verrucomicrobiaceae bacterium]|nr:metallophosphoesterase [Verrucomicrobiaceae bacterium]